MNLLSILIVGHRNNRLETHQAPLVQESIERILSNIASRASSLTNKKDFAIENSLRIITGTSSGTDKIAGNIAQKFCWPLHIIGFKSELNESPVTSKYAERVVLLPGLSDISQPLTDSLVSIRDDIALCYADCLIAVWDNKDAKGYAGGTLRLIRDAAIRGRPAIIISPDGKSRYLSSLNLKQATKNCLSCIDPDPKEIEEQLVNYNPDLFFSDLAEFLQQAKSIDLAKQNNSLFMPASVSKPSWHFWKPGVVHELLVALSTIDLLATKKAWERDMYAHYYGVSSKELSASMQEQHPISEPTHWELAFRPQDVLANKYAGGYRDVTWCLYGLSAFAVFAAVAGELAIGGEHISAIWALTELFALAGIFLVYRLVKKRGWHDKWLAHRFNAESIRYARVGHPFVLPADILYKEGPALDVSGQSSLAKDEIFLRRLFINEGLPKDRHKTIYDVEQHIDACIDYAVHVIKDQVAYHKKKMHESRHVAHSLHRITNFCFLITGIGVIGHFFIHISEWLLLTAALPAAAAAIHGIGEKNGFERLAAISSTTLADLYISLSALDECKRRGPSVEKKWMLARKLVSTATQSMAGSNQQWREIVIQKNMTLPA